MFLVVDGGGGMGGCVALRLPSGSVGKCRDGLGWRTNWRLGGEAAEALAESSDQVILSRREARIIEYLQQVSGKHARSTGRRTREQNRGGGWWRRRWLLLAADDDGAGSFEELHEPAVASSSSSCFVWRRAGRRMNAPTTKY